MNDIMMFEEITKDMIPRVYHIVNSNPQYNQLENGHPIRTMDEVSDEFLNPDTKSYLVQLDEKNVGVIDYLMENPNDHYPWIGLFMIHRQFQSKGYGTTIYQAFEERLKNEGNDVVRLGVLETNDDGVTFWESLGFIFYEARPWRDKTVLCYEKQF